MSNVQVQIGGNTVQVQVQSSGFARANAAVTAAAASATAAAASAASAAATLAAAALKANNLSDLASASTVRTNLGVAIGTNVQAYSANLDEYAAVNPTAAGLALLDDADASAQRTTLGLGSIATQAASAVAITGGSIAGITDLAVADGGTGASSASAARDNLGLTIGTNVQAYDADLTTWAGITPGTGVATALAANVGSAGAFTTFNGAGGTPSSLTLTNATGLPVAGGGTGAATAADARTNLAVVGTAALAASTGAALVGGIQSGTGAAAETVQATNRRVVYSDQFSTPQQAVTAAGSGGTVIFPRGATTTLTTPILLTGLTNIRLVGYGHAMRSGATRINSYIDCSGATNVIIEGFNFDGRMADMPVYTQADFDANNLTYNTPVVANGATASWSNITVRDCSMTALYTNFAWFYQGGIVNVQNCVLNAPVCTQTYSGTAAAQQYSFVYLQTIEGKISVTGNSFLGAAITNPALGVNAVFYSGTTGSVYIANNRAEYCGRDNVGTHRLGVFDGYGDSVNVTVENNTCTFAMGMFAHLSAHARAKVLNNNVIWSANCEASYNGLPIESTITFGGQKGCQDILVQGNTFDDPSRRHAQTIVLAAYDYGTPLTNIRIIDNVITKATLGVGVFGPQYDIVVEGNRMPDATVGIQTGAAPGGVTLTTTLGTEANGVYDRVFIRNNFIREIGSGGNGISISYGTFTTATVGYILVEGNDLQTAGGAGYGIILLGFSTNTARNEIIARNNRVRGYGYHAYFRDGGYFTWQNNKCSNPATGDYNDGGGWLTLEKTGNRLSLAGARLGSATLVAGTVTVSSAEIRTGDTVRLIRKTIGGTPGYLSLGTITNATSFVINSNNAADTSVVDWEIVH